MNHELEKRLKPHDLAKEALQSCRQSIEILLKKIEEVSREYGQDNLQKGHALFSETLEILNLFIQLMAKTTQILLENKNDPEMKKTIQKLEIHLLSVVKAIYTAHQSNDFVMLCDLLEYEIVDNLTKWKIEVLSKLEK